MSTPATVKTHREPLLHTVKHAERSGRQTVALRLAAVALSLVAGGIFILAITLATGIGQADQMVLPIWLMFFCALNMGLGTAVGGKKIIKSVGMDMVKMEKYQGFAASLGATLCLMLATFTGMPVSTTHTKTTAIMGVGAAKRKSSVKWSVAIDMVKTWADVSGLRPSGVRVREGFPRGDVTRRFADSVHMGGWCVRRADHRRKCAKSEGCCAHIRR